MSEGNEKKKEKENNKRTILNIGQLEIASLEVIYFILFKNYREREI